MNKSEKEVIRNVIARLECRPRPDGTNREAFSVRQAFIGEKRPDDWKGTFEPREASERGETKMVHTPRLYLNTWVIGALSSLLDEEDGGCGRDLDLAVSLSR